MAFPNHLSQDHDMPPDHHLPQNSPTTTRLPLLHHSSSDVKPAADGHQPTWLNTANLRHQTHFSVDANFLNLHTNSTHPSSSTNQWLSRSILQPTVVSNADVHQVSNAISHESAHLDNTNNINIHIDDRASNDNKKDHQSTESETTGGRAAGSGTNCTGEGSAVNWQAASRCKAELLSHPLYEQLLSAHVACLRIATPVDQLPRIDAQLARSHHVVAKYFALGNGNLGHHKELDQFMTHYILLLCSFKEQLQQHVRVHAMEAVMACWEIEQSLQSIAGVSPGEGTGATMSDDDGGDSEDQIDSDSNLFDGPDSMGFGLFIPTESERSLMERVRQELKHELKNGYKEKIVDIREEILRKRRAGKLPGNTTSVLKAWWQSHSKWPYPTEEDKARLVQETGLNPKQINNWFINQRKRNWHGNPSSSTPLKTKRKR